MFYILKDHPDSWMENRWLLEERDQETLGIDQKEDHGGLDWMEPMEMENLRLAGNSAEIFHALDGESDGKRGVKDGWWCC